MDWEKAKKMFIYLLIVLNIGLFGLNISSEDKYKITKSREEAIYEVLNEKGIGIYCDIIKETKPMRAINISTSDVDTNRLKEEFFSSDEEVKTTLEFDKITFESDTRKIETQENFVRFYCEGGTGKINNFSRETAIAAAEEFVEKMMYGNSGKNTIENITLTDDGSYIFSFDDVYNGYKIFSNEKTVVVSENGITYAQAIYYDVESFFGEKQEICGCDEAILTVIYDIEKDENAFGKYIEEIELGYDFQDFEEVYDTAAVRLVPCYRIYVSGMDEPYTINAYTNEIVERQ